MTLNSVTSMYAVGQVKMAASDMHEDDDNVHAGGDSESGGFVIWQKNPDLWYFELVVAGYKVSAGSDGKVAWNQSSSQPSHANRGPPRPLRRFFQVIFFQYRLLMLHNVSYIYVTSAEKKLGVQIPPFHLIRKEEPFHSEEHFAMN